MKPAEFVIFRISQHTAKGRPHVGIGAAARRHTAAGGGKAHDSQDDDDHAGNVGKDSGRSEALRRKCRQHEDTGADDVVEDRGCELTDAERTDELGICTSRSIKRTWSRHVLADESLDREE